MVVVVVVVAVVVEGRGCAALAFTSTCFLERGRPRCMWRSQYFWSGATSREHRHFFPSVRRHLPGSGSTLFENLKLNVDPLPTTKKTHHIRQ